jgi:transketolase
VEATTGSLGHGLSIGLGMALAGKFDKKKYRVFVMLSDGECDEGSVWEAALYAGFHHVDNLIAIIDYNKIQSFGRTKEVMDLEPFTKKLEAFGWSTKEIDGHNFNEIIDVLSNTSFKKNAPICIIAHTIKGKGVSYMEDKLEWHYRAPVGELRGKALEELEAQKL